MTRGERNHNPGNIRESPDDRTQWVGERATDDDHAFEEFKTPQDGIRALAVVLLQYQKKHGLSTVREIINRWAPPVENNTTAYVNSVANQMGVGADEDLDLRMRPDQLSDMVKAIIRHENGRCIYTSDVIDAGVDRAL